MIEAARHRNDANYKESLPLFLRSPKEQITYHHDRIAFETRELQRPDWQLGSNAAAVALYCADCRRRIESHRFEIESIQKEDSNAR